MGLLGRMKDIAAKAAQTVAAQAPGVAQKALTLGAAAASATANAATNALDATKDFVADKLKGNFSDVDVEQGAGALEIAQVGLRNPDGTFRLLTEDERRAITKMVLVATLEDDDRPAADPDDGED